LFLGTVSTWQVYSFVPSSGEITSFTEDVKPFVTYLTSNKGISTSQYLVQLQAGTEPFVSSSLQLITGKAVLIKPSPIIDRKRHLDNNSLYCEGQLNGVLILLVVVECANQSSISVNPRLSNLGNTEFMSSKVRATNNSHRFCELSRPDYTPMTTQRRYVAVPDGEERALH